MNYRHAYHAGNFADVLKHAVLARVVTYMTQKPQPFRVIDTHAGAGLYDLTAVEASKTLEWRDGIGRVMSLIDEGSAKALLAPYLDAVRSVNVEAGSENQPLRHYPGSPLIARHLMRREDVLVANELHPEDFAALKANLPGRAANKVTNLDAWTALKAMLPPKERRGVILIDPPFEAAGEFDAFGDAMKEALARFANGVYILWYPLKSEARGLEQFRREIAGMAPNRLDVSLAVAAPAEGLGLTNTGLTVINPPYTLADELRVLLPELLAVLEEGPGAGYTLDAAGS